MCTQGLSAPVWDQTQTDPLPCARGLNLNTRSIRKFYWPSASGVAMGGLGGKCSSIFAKMVLEISLKLMRS